MKRGDTQPSQGDSADGYALRGPAVVRELRRSGQTTPTALSRRMGGVPKQTMHTTLNYLSDANVVVKSKSGKEVWLNPDLAIVVGVDVTHNQATVAVAGLDFDPHNDPGDESARRKIQIGNPGPTLEAIAALIADQLSRHFTAEQISSKLMGVGLVLPGPILREPNPEPRKEAANWNRSVAPGHILPGWDKVNAAARLATLLKEQHGILPPRHDERHFVWVENDASAGALGVHTQGQQGNAAIHAPEDLVYVRVTAGIGAGIVNKGHLLAGSSGVGGEIGHVVLDGVDTLCPSCGGRGCLETLASDRAVVGQLGHIVAPSDTIGEADSRAASASKIDDAGVEGRLRKMLSSGHPAVERALWDAGWRVGTVLAKVCCILNPSWIVLDGQMPEHVTPSDEHAASVSRPAGADTGPDEQRPFVAAVRHALVRDTLRSAYQAVRVYTWQDVKSPQQTMSPELLGSLALVLDHLGDGCLLRPVERWISNSNSRGEALDLAESCGAIN